ncbi:MAG: helix-turn-helix transcriptional regulator [Paludibacter sp.]|nr:helix-turn-helix transcriptional regulator [Paludibacter sp.]
MDEREKIEKIMLNEKMNSVQFATEIGIQGSTLSHILNGRNKPSLDVLKKILNRYRTINPDWLILDVGTMYRQEKHSQTLTLFDSESENQSVSDNYTEKISEKKEPQLSTKENEIVNIASQLKNSDINKPVSVETTESQPLRSVKKIIIYYTDNTFEEFESNR